MARSLENRVAIITGAGKGLGAATALKLAQEGAIIVVNDLDSASATQVASSLEKLTQKDSGSSERQKGTETAHSDIKSARVMVSHHDVSKYASAGELAEQVISQFGRIDILVNNAGITRDAMLHKLTEEKWDEVIRVNLKGPFNMGQACAKHMVAQKSGKILNLASVAYLGNVGQTNYSASKAGVVGMTRTWAVELAKYNINVNAIAPGLIDSALTQQIPAEIKDRFVQKIPLHRIGKPEEIAELIAFLVSDASSYITGQCIHIDGGLTAGIS